MLKLIYFLLYAMAMLYVCQSWVKTYIPALYDENYRCGYALLI